MKGAIHNVFFATGYVLYERILYNPVTCVTNTRITHKVMGAIGDSSCNHNRHMQYTEDNQIIMAKYMTPVVFTTLQRKRPVYTDHTAGTLSSPA